MLGKALCLCLVVGLAAPGMAGAQPPPTDPEIVKGMRQVDEGDYDAAIVTLDTAARRLSSDPGKTRELSHAYLYLGIAYVGKGHEAAAKAKFREAVAGIKDLTLSADKYPPKVINLFEAARDEARTASVVPAAAPREPVKKGGHKGLLIGGLVVAAGGGAALALKGGGSDSSGGCDTFFAGPSGLLNPSQPAFEFNVGPAQAGHWTANVRWTVVELLVPGPPPAGVKIYVDDASANTIAESRLLTETSAIAEWDGGAGSIFKVKLFMQGEARLTYETNVDGPCR